jgi:hypothetical protein
MGVIVPDFEPEVGSRRRLSHNYSRQPDSDMTTSPALTLSICIAVTLVGITGPAAAQVCSHDGPVVNCDDGRRGLLSGDAIIWTDGTRSSASPHPSVVIGNKPSVHVGQGVFVGQGKGVVPLDDPNAPNKTRCAILDGVSYCY